MCPTTSRNSFSGGLEARDSLDRELIIRFFRSCALTVVPDGYEDDQIHCLKDGQLCHAGSYRLTSIQQAVSASRAPNPFAGFTMSDIQEAAPENSLTDFPKDGVFFRVVYRNLALMLFCCKINITTVAENGENLISGQGG